MLLADIGRFIKNDIDYLNEHYYYQGELPDWIAEDARVAIRAAINEGCKGILRATEASFRARWYKEDAFTGKYE